MKLEKFIELHSTLQNELEVVKYDYKQIFNIFQKHEDDFLIYCDVVSNIGELREFIKTKMMSNREIREEVERLTKDSFLTNRNKDAQDSLDYLLYRIAEAIMRYPLVLAAIAKEARKLDSTLIEKEALKTQAMMHEIVLHVDKCSRETKNIETVRKLEISMKCGNALSDPPIGLLLFEVNEIEIRMKNSESAKKCCVLVFEEVLVVIEMRESKTFEKDKNGEIVMDWFGYNPKIKQMTRNYRFPSRFKIANFVEINSVENGKILEINTFTTGFREDPSRSFEMFFSTTDDRQEFADILKNQQSEIKKLKEAKTGSKHINHTFKKYSNKYLDKVLFYPPSFIRLKISNYN